MHRNADSPDFPGFFCLPQQVPILERWLIDLLRAEPVKIDITKEPRRLVDIFGSDFVRERNQDLVAFSTDKPRRRLPLPFACVNIEQIYTKVEGVRDNTVASCLPCRGEDGLHRTCLQAIRRISVGAEREQRHVHIGLPQAAIDHPGASELV
jgi:hypothetical protein